MNTSNYIRRLNAPHDLAARERKSQIQLDSKKIWIESRTDRSLDTIEQIKIKEKVAVAGESRIQEPTLGGQKFCMWLQIIRKEKFLNIFVYTQRNSTVNWIGKQIQQF